MFSYASSEENSRGREEAGGVSGEEVTKGSSGAGASSFVRRPTVQGSPGSSQHRQQVPPDDCA